MERKTCEGCKYYIKRSRGPSGCDLSTIIQKVCIKCIDRPYYKEKEKKNGVPE